MEFGSVVEGDTGEDFPGIDNSRRRLRWRALYHSNQDLVWLLEQARRLGASEYDLLAAYPSLRAEDLANAWAYVRSHASEISAQIRDNETG